MLTTHALKEAEYIGDRIAILTNGVLQAYGTSYFLKTKYGKGYTLKLLKGPNLQVELVTELLKRHIESIKVMKLELTYVSYYLKQYCFSSKKIFVQN